MNSLLIGKDCNLSKNIIVENKSIISLLDIFDKHKTHIILKENSSLTINLFSKKAFDLDIKIDLYDNSKLIVNSSFINNDYHKEIIDVNLLGSNINVFVNVRGINNKSDVQIILNGSNKSESKNNIFHEYAKVINNTNSKNILIPNLLVDNYTGIFNHGVSIGHINEKNIFYLESKGIERNKAKKMLENGFILSVMDENIKEKIKAMLKED